MKYTKLLIFIGVFGLCSLGQAQSVFHLIQKNGSDLVYNLTDIRTITFPSQGVMSILKNDGSSKSISTSNILRMDFTKPVVTSVYADYTPFSKAGISIFPVPVNEVLNISGLSAELAHVSLKDASGNTVKEENVSNGKMNVSELKAGIYFCRIQTSNQIQTIKFVK